MNKRYSALILLIAAVIFFSLPAIEGSAKIFENMTRGGRALALGGAFVAGSGSDSLFYNVAGSRTIKGIEAGFSFQPGNLHEDLTTLSASVVVGLPVFSVGGYLNMLDLDGIVTETTIVAGGSMDLPVLKGVFKRFSVGVAARMYLLSKDFTQGTEKDSDQAFSVDIGLQAQIGDAVVIGLAGINLLSPELSFYNGGPGTGEATDREVRFGLKVNVLKEFALYGDYAIYPDADSDVGIKGLHLGAEIVFYDVFMLRFGIDEGDLTIGAGVSAKMMDINLSIKSKGMMGLYYQAGLVVKL